MSKKIRVIGAAVVAGLWLILTGFTWFSSNQIYSFTERKYLDKFPELTMENILEKDNEKLKTESFMTEFNSYTLDQFPLRDAFITVKAACELAVGKTVNNDVYFGENETIFAGVAKPAEGEVDILFTTTITLWLSSSAL